MSRTIQIEDQTFERLKAWARPLEDSPDDAINRVLDAAEGGRPVLEAPARAPSEETPVIAPFVTRLPERGPGRSRGPETSEILRAAGLLASGTVLVVDPAILPSGASVGDARFRARIGREVKWVVWERDGQEHSLSELTQAVRDRFGVHANRGAVNGYKYWCLESNPNRTLWELAQEILLRHR